MSKQRAAERTEAGGPEGTARGPRGSVWRAAIVPALLLALAATLTGAAGLRATLAPLHLPLAGMAGDVLSKRIGAAVAVEGVALALRSTGVELVLDGITAKHRSYAVAVPRVRVLHSLDGRRVRIEGAEVAIAGSATRDGAAVLPKAGLETLNGALARVVELAERRAVRSVSLHDGRVGSAAGGSPQFRDVSAELIIGEGAIEANATMIGAGGPLALKLTRAADGTQLALSTEGFVPADLAADPPVRSGFSTAASFDGAFASDGSLEGAQASIVVGPGIIAVGPDPERTVDEVRIALSLGADGVVEVRPSRLVAGGTEVTVSGRIVPEQFAPWAYTLRADGALFDPPGANGPPILVPNLAASGHIDLAASLIEVDELVLAGPTARLDAVLALDLSEVGPGLTGAVRIGPSKVETLLSAWPPVLAHEAREALTESLLGGIVRSVELELALGPAALDGDPETRSALEGAVRAEASFVDATIALPDHPIAVQDAAGRLTLRDDALSVALRHGTIPVDGAEPLVLGDGRISIRDLSESPAVISLEATVEGGLDAVVGLADLFGAATLKGTHLSPRDVTGRILADVALVTPLGPGVSIADEEWAIDAKLTGAGTTVPVNGQIVSAADVEVLVNPRRLAARGSSTIDGLAVEVNYSEVFAGGASGGASGAARFVLTDRDRAERGFDTGGRLLGPIVVTVSQDEDGERTITADLTEARVELPGLRKAAGEGLSGEALVHTDEDVVEIKAAHFEGEAIDLRGTARLEAGRLRSLELERLVLSDGDEARLAVRQGDEGGYAVSFAASRFDARPLLQELRGAARSDAVPRADAPRDGGAETERTPITLTADVARARIGQEAKLHDLSLRATHDGEALQRLDARGGVASVPEAEFAIALRPSSAEARALSVDVADLGGTLQALGLYERMRGGRLAIDATVDAEGTASGRLNAADFSLFGERTLEDIVERARRTARDELDQRDVRLAFAERSDKGGLGFDRLVIDFRKEGDTIALTEAILKGPVLGGTAEGVIDLGEGTILLNGTFIPAYGVNNLFGRVPLVGSILGGGAKGGLIGVTFRLAGPIEDPTLLVNPISAIAPGIFRRIFEFR